MLNKIQFWCSLFLISSCASIFNYTSNRVDDLTDIPIIGIEQNVYGAGFHFWCVGGGIQSSVDASGVGLRNGNFGIYNLSSQKKISFSKLRLPSGLSTILFNSYGHHTKNSNPRSKNKNFRFASYVFFVPNIDECNAPVGFEFSMGLYVGFRFGINFSEIGDFFLGIVGADYKRDDHVLKNKEDISDQEYNNFENRELDQVEKKELEELRRLSGEPRKKDKMKSDEDE